MIGTPRGPYKVIEKLGAGGVLIALALSLVGYNADTESRRH